MKQITALAEKYEEKKKAMEDAEQAFKDAKEAFRQVSEVDIPEAFAEEGVTKIETDDGRTIKVFPYYGARIKEEQEEDAFCWLYSNGHGGAIKNAGSFVYDDDCLIDDVLDIMDNNNIDYEVKRSIHPQTLKSIVRGTLEEGKSIPMDVFNVHVGQKTSIK